MARAMTPRQRAALRKAQLASARKRKGRGKKKASGKKRRLAKAALVAGAVAVAGGVAYGQRNNVKKRIKKKAENNQAIRVAMTKKLMAEARARRAKRG